MSIAYKNYAPEYAEDIIRLTETWIKEKSTVGIKKETAKELNAFLPEYFFVAFNDSKAVGFIKCEIEKKSKIAAFPKGSTYLYIADMYVLPKFRKLGVGSKLIELAEAKAKENGIKYVFLCCPSTNHDAARRFYTKNKYNLFTMDFYKQLEGEDAT